MGSGLGPDGGDDDDDDDGNSNGVGLIDLALTAPGNELELVDFDDEYAGAESLLLTKDLECEL